jgi:1-deoxy-D-xylulose-5-phosphate reductoisomerase
MASSSSKQTLTILGSTGSIGVNTLRVVAANRENYEVFALTAKSQVDLLFEQCMEFQVAYAVMLDKAAALQLKDKLLAAGSTTQVLEGLEGLNFVAGHEENDCVMAAIVGGAGLLPTLQAATN